VRKCRKGGENVLQCAKAVSKIVACLCSETDEKSPVFMGRKRVKKSRFFEMQKSNL
jgi:hypothetical protein